jgi:two-component system, cell cycle response regulator
MKFLKRPSEYLIMVVDDDKDNVMLVARTLEYEGFRVETANTGEEAMERLNRCSPDLILLDINMPGMGGLEALKQIRTREPYIWVIFVSARNETNDIILGLDSGADDYLCKPFEPLELLARVRAQLRIKDVTDKLAAANARLQALVDIDDLTGLYNMRSIYTKLENEISRARRNKTAVAVIMMDMDNFKRVNDSHDHLFGSFVLSEVGKIIRNNIRGVDFGARYGGDEYLIALSDTTAEGASLFAERIRKIIMASVFEKDRDSMKLTASLGVAVHESHMTPLSARDLVRAADRALYEAKRGGRNKVCSYDMSTVELIKT